MGYGNITEFEVRQHDIYHFKLHIICRLKRNISKSLYFHSNLPPNPQSVNNLKYYVIKWAGYLSRYID
jgi:hypothetical protein